MRKKNSIFVSTKEYFSISSTLKKNIMNSKFPQIDCFVPWIDDAQVAETVSQLNADPHVSAVHFLKEEGVSVISNLYPKAMHNLIDYLRHDMDSEAEKTESMLLPIIKALFLDTNPAPLKYALSRLGLCTGEMRLPMYEVSDGVKETIDRLIRSADVALE